MLVALTLPIPTSSRAQQTTPSDLCSEEYSGRRAHRCEQREEMLSGQKALDVDPGQHGGIQVRGWNRTDVRLRTKIDAWADTDARARELVAGVRVTSVGGRIRSDGPSTLNRDHWGTAFYLDVPPNIGLVLNARNGGISIEEYRGAATMRTENGGIRLRDVGGDIKGFARNGGLRIELAGARWEGAGLDVETRNGGVQLTLPANYSAELETGTVNGSVRIDFPVMIHAGRERRFTTTLGSGGPKIRAITTNGAVTVVRS
jgi:hypothetical protein